MMDSYILFKCFQLNHKVMISTVQTPGELYIRGKSKVPHDAAHLLFVVEIDVCDLGISLSYSLFLASNANL